MSEKNEFDFEKDQNTNIDVTGGTDMDTNENENSVQETVQQTGENGFVMSVQPQPQNEKQNQNNNPNNNQYNFWQQQSGGMGQQQYGYNNANYFTNQQQQPTPPQKKKKEYKLLKNVGKAALVGIVAGVGFCGVVLGSNKLGIIDKQNNTVLTKSSNNTIEATVVSSGGAVNAPNNLTEVVNKCMPSIVSINSTITSTYNSYFGSYNQDETGSGSGIILKISDDEILIVTNNHVISDAKKIMVGFNGASEDDMVQATVKGTDSTRDLAVVLVKTKDVPKNILKNITAAEIGSSDDMQVGQMAIAIGNALGYGQSMTVGYISAKDRTVAVDEGTNMTLLQTDAAINPGNSGGALLNSDGQVIGINSAKYADTSVEGMGFAIPISDAISVINDLMDREVLTDDEKGYLGISGTNITESDQQQMPNIPVGIYVREVSEDGAAKDAGIMVGDIIVGIGDEEITTIKELSEKVNSYRVGTKITLKIKRNENGKYKEKKIKVTLKGKDTLKSISGSDSSSNSSQDNSSDSNNNNGSNGNNGSQGNNGNNGDNGNNGNSGNNGSQGNSSEDDMQNFYNYFFGESGN
ncbi:2-alkenal reductase [Clostridium sp. CAG:411]|jgi:serine protease Do|nr:trypsin-like peptidase domain-containing protein [Lachnospiraceae bacterium]CDE42821.1 2-alkenal reductase [Clostridium sp. CAG:411]